MQPIARAFIHGLYADIPASPTMPARSGIRLYVVTQLRLSSAPVKSSQRTVILALKPGDHLLLDLGASARFTYRRFCDTSLAGWKATRITPGRAGFPSPPLRLCCDLRLMGCGVLFKNASYSLAFFLGAIFSSAHGVAVSRVLLSALLFVSHCAAFAPGAPCATLHSSSPPSPSLRGGGQFCRFMSTLRLCPCPCRPPTERRTFVTRYAPSGSRRRSSSPGGRSMSRCGAGSVARARPFQSAASPHGVPRSFAFRCRRASSNACARSVGWSVGWSVGRSISRSSSSVGPSVTWLISR